MTRFELIKSLTLDQMAEFLENRSVCDTCSHSPYEMCLDVSDCTTHIKEWLESEDDVNGLLPL